MAKNTLPDFSFLTGAIVRHYMGDCYRVICSAQKVKTEQHMIIYERIYRRSEIMDQNPKNRVIWARDMDSFLDHVKKDNEMIPCFKRIDPTHWAKLNSSKR